MTRHVTPIWIDYKNYGEITGKGKEPISSFNYFEFVSARDATSLKIKKSGSDPLTHWVRQVGPEQTIYAAH